MAKTSEGAQKQRTNIYTMMLILSFFAIVTGCVLMYVELTRYGESNWWDTNAATVAPRTSWIAPSGEEPYV